MDVRDSRPRMASIDIHIEGGGTGTGFQKFCEGKTAVNAASRPIMSTEMRLCASRQVTTSSSP